MSITGGKHPLDSMFERVWHWRDEVFSRVSTGLKDAFDPAIEPIAPRIRAEAGKRLANITHEVHAATARIVLDAQIDAVRILREASASLDTKANGIIVASGALLVAFVTISPVDKSHIPHWSLLIALVLIASGFLAGIAAMFVAGFSLPTPAVYNRYSTLVDPRNEGKICSELTEAWYRYALRERLLNARKANRVTLGFALLSCALLVLVIGAALAVFGQDAVNRSSNLSASWIHKR
jgi:hypothetical protein